MRRVVSLYLPSLATDRLRRLDASAGRPPPPDRASSSASASIAPLVEDDEFACSCPRGGGWRPGARWARTEGAGAAMATREERIAAMPAHQRPSPRELGRRSEAADPPFRRRRAGSGNEDAPMPDEIFGAWAPAPLVTAGPDGNRIVIRAADAAAMAKGLVPGMALTHARALEPGLDIRDDDPAADRALLDRLVLLAVRRWTPTAMADADMGILMDVTGAAHLHGGEDQMARRLIRLCRRLGLDARVAVAGTIGAAHALARYGGQPVMLCDIHGEAHALACLPVAALRLDLRQRSAARRLGIERVADLLAMPRAPLARRFGTSLLERLDQALGRVAEPFDAFMPYEVPQEEVRFAEPIGGAETIARAVGELAVALADSLRARGLGARIVRLVCDRVDREQQQVTIGMARATRDVAHVLRLLSMTIETIDPGFGIDAMRLIAIRTESLGATALEGDLGGRESARDIGDLIDQIAMRLGGQAAFRFSAVESDVPERSVVRIAPMAEAADWSLPWPRPIRLLRHPERIDGVIALLPDQPPRRFVWRGTAHVVACADGPERITGEWWKRTSEAFAVRDYFRVENERGERFWIFRRGDGEHDGTGDLSWWVHGLFG
jgi:protein ImuB